MKCTIIERSLNSTPKLLELISEFSESAGYKINIQESVEFLYSNNELSEREVKGHLGGSVGRASGS